jgi:uncharacterized protein HemX
MASEEDKPVVVDPETGPEAAETTRVETPETAEAEAERAPVEEGAADAVPDLADEPGPGAGPKRALVALGAAALALVIAVAVLGVFLVRERSAHDDTRRALRAEAARAAQLDRDLAEVRAAKAEAEKKLAAAEAQLLSPEAKAAIANCVKVYATLEKVMEEADRNGSASGGVEIIVPVTGPGIGASGNVCVAAEPHLAKIG